MNELMFWAKKIGNCHKISIVNFFVNILFQFGYYSYFSKSNKKNDFIGQQNVIEAFILKQYLSINHILKDQFILRNEIIQGFFDETILNLIPESDDRINAFI